ncbi:hypothetical protein BS78_08G033300 [Paspalum vaginatum]|nr:hypothetical protein BS78_08G033300 [Paspalum vaginatum]
MKSQSRIWKRSRKEMEAYQRNMNMHTKRDCVAKNKADQTAKTRQGNCATTSKDNLIPSNNQKTPALLRPKDDLSDKKLNTMKMKEQNTQRSPNHQLNGMSMLVPKANDINNRLSSRVIAGSSNSNQGEVTINLRDSSEKFEFTKRDHMDKSTRNQTRQFGTDLSNCPRDDARNNGVTWLDKNVNQMDLISQTNSKLCNVRQLTNSNGKSKRSRSLLEEKPQKNDDIHDGVVKLDNQTSRPLKKIRRFLEMEDRDVKVEDGCTNQNCMSAEDNEAKFTPQNIVWNDTQARADVPSSVQLECYCCSKPIDEPAWSGIFRIDGKEYMSLDGHLSTKSGKEAWKLSKSLPPIVNVSKASRLEVWPKRWETSKPNDNNIGLYLFPHEIRPNEEIDQLVKELMENDLALLADIAEAQMLIFPSILLPRRYQTFQSKHYMWGVFKPKEDKVVAVAESVATATCYTQDVDKETCLVSNQSYEAQCKHLGQELNSSKSLMPLEKQSSPSRSLHHHDVTGINIIQGRLGMDWVEVKAPHEVGQGDALCPTMRTTEGNTISTKDIQLDDPSVRHPTGNFFCFVAQQTPEVEQFIRKLALEGALVCAGPLSGNIDLPCSSILVGQRA